MSSLQPPISCDQPRHPAPRPAKPTSVPRILWPSIEFEQRIQNRDLEYFPERSLIIERHNWGVIHKSLALTTFETAVGQSYDHILILDLHFDEFGVNSLAAALASSQAGDIRLLTGGGDKTEMKDTLTDFRNLNQTGSSIVEVRWTSNLDKHRYPFLHDRFAIVDGALWHFGSTVGGGHPGLTAATGPWSADQTNAKQFFEECWKTSHA